MLQPWSEAVRSSQGFSLALCYERQRPHQSDVCSGRIPAVPDAEALLHQG